MISQSVEWQNRAPGRARRMPGIIPKPTGSGYLTQRELYRLGLLTTLFFLAVFLTIGTGWLMLVAH